MRKRYLIVRAIGRGGMAAVYEARDTRNGTSCAIKEMSLSTVPTNERSQAIQNFLAEARILSRLKHSNLPAFTDFFTEGTRYFLVMEFIDGHTLEELLEANNGPFSERRVLGWARQLCDVLEYLHGQQPPVIFRDLKPGNIMLTRDGRIKLIDFGIARLFRASGSQDTQLLGTPGFAPPEQYGSAQTDERSDIYSLAMTLAQLMTDAVNETGFGLKDLHFTYPHISPPVARVLEKATSLKPDDRYESVTVFRRALLGIGTFRFENGGEATTPDELAELCEHYHEEAADYLFAGEVESWLQEIGKDEMARAAKRLRVTVGDPEMAVERLIQLLLGKEVRSRAGQGGNGQSGAQTRGEAGSRAGRVREREPALIVEPKTIDFGQVYPGLSAPILLTISGSQGALVSGSLRVVENWIILDQTTFDGTKIPVNVRIDSTRLRGSTHYTGTIMITPDEGEREIAVTVEADVMGFTTITLARKQAGQSSGAGLDDDDEQVVPGTGRVRMAPQATVTVDVPLDTSQTTEYTSKYGMPGSGGWDPLQGISARQSGRMQRIMTFLTAFMTSGFFYFAFAHLQPFIQSPPNPPIPPNPWFTAVLIGMVPMATIGVALINWLSTLRTREAINGLSTSLAIGLVALALCEAGWQNVFGAGAPVLHLLVMLIVSALATTIGAQPRVSNGLINGALWGMRRLRWLMIALAMLLGGALGFALTTNLGIGCFTPFGVLLGIGVGALLVLRVDRLLKQKPHP
ncbi:MAG TPA: serine/threonine-protein kinase [Ktedonobacteraceae bacterium]|nr:serine/threonine-protein kinase [Ktedonobacteraceae bacterium]